jgi:hypothetical protein
MKPDFKVLVEIFGSRFEERAQTRVAPRFGATACGIAIL